MKLTRLATVLTMTWGCAHALAAPAPQTPPRPEPPPPPGQQQSLQQSPLQPSPPGAPRIPDTQAVPPTGAPLPAPSSAAQKLYSSAKADLLQVRSLLKSGRTQSSVGSGFLVGTGNLAVTNYHVVSQFALEPENYTGEWVDTAGQRGNVELLAVDVLHDLAVVRVNRNGTGMFNVPEQLAPLSQGQYLYSLGNPLDLGFAISEGSYNGVISRSFYDQLMFTGPINSGMSGGPSVTVAGDIAGVNVSKRLDGELVSFLVPARYAQELLKKVPAGKAPPRNFTTVVVEQLLQHQQAMVDQLLATPMTLKAMGPYRVPVRESEQMRCWGRSDVKENRPYAVDLTTCSMESAVFVSGNLQTGAIGIRHQFMRSTGLDAVRFAQLSSASFKNEDFGRNKDRHMTGPQCTEMFVKNKSLPLRAVLCVRAYKKFTGLYDFSLLTASTDEDLMSLQSRMDARGVSYDNGMRATKAFLDALARGAAK